MKGVRTLFVLVVTVLGSICLAGCATYAKPQPTPKPYVEITGTVRGEQIAAAEAGQIRAVPLPSATVTCDGITMSTALDGSFSVAVPSSSSYKCIVSSTVLYVTTTVTLPGHGQSKVLVDFSEPTLPPAANASCQSTGILASFKCPMLTLVSGSIAGAFTDETHAPLTYAYVQCATVSSLRAAAAAGTLPEWNSAVTDAEGTYVVASLPVGKYTCEGLSPSGDAALATDVTLAPAGTVHVPLSACSKCYSVNYHGGPVMHQVAAHLIFWLPPGQTFDPYAGSSTFESKMAQYFDDIRGTAFYNIVTQYYDYAGPARNDVSLAGTYLDTQPYPHAATKSDPLFDSDIQAEIQRVQQSQHWPTGLNNEFFVFTAYGAVTCMEHKANLQDTYCTFPNGKNSMCGYHGNISTSKSPTIYALLGDASNTGVCVFSGQGFPNGDGIIQSVLDTLSHEHFESVTDPDVGTAWSGGWYKDVPSGSDELQEIGDICQGYVLPVFNDNGNVTLASGHDYLLQSEWNNHAGACRWS